VTIKFEWKENKRPKDPSAEQVQDTICAALRHFKDPRKICSSVVAIYLEQDTTNSKVEGVGYTKDDIPIVTFRYSLRAPMICLCDYYEKPLYPQT
jgi:hypothetical protein